MTPSPRRRQRELRDLADDLRGTDTALSLSAAYLRPQPTLAAYLPFRFREAVGEVLVSRAVARGAYELAAGRELGHEEDGGRRLVRLDELDDVRVVERLEHLKLLDQCIIPRMDILRTNHHLLQLEVTNVRMSEVDVFMYFKYHIKKELSNIREMYKYSKYS